MTLKKSEKLRIEYKGVVITICYVTGYVSKVHIEDGSFVGGRPMELKSTIAEALLSAKNYIDWMGEENF